MKLPSLILSLSVVLATAATAQTQVALVPADAVPAGFEVGMVYPITDVERLHRASPNPILIPLEGVVHLPIQERKGKHVIFLSAEVPTAKPLWEIQLHGEPVGPDSADPAENEWAAVEKQPEFDMELLMSSLQYPAQARADRIQGQVIIGALIGHDGVVERLRIEKSDHASLNAAAATAVATTPFVPGIANGVPVRLWVRIPVTFKLD